MCALVSIEFIPAYYLVNTFSYKQFVDLYQCMILLALLQNSILKTKQTQHFAHTPNLPPKWSQHMHTTTATIIYYCCYYYYLTDNTFSTMVLPLLLITVTDTSDVARDFSFNYAY